MASFTFGLTIADLEQDDHDRIARAVEEDRLNDVVDVLASDPARFTLPHVRGHPENVARLRSRYYQTLAAAFSEDDLRAALSREIASLAEGAPGLILKSEGIAFEGEQRSDPGDCYGLPSWICEPACGPGMPDWLCDWLDLPKDLPPQPPMEIIRTSGEYLNEDGTVETVVYYF